MTFVLFPALLLFKLKLTLFFGFTLFFGELSAFRLHLFLHQLQRLLRLSSDACGTKLLLCIALPPFGIVSSLLCFCLDSRTVYMLWGGYARGKAYMIDKTRNLVLESVHPSPLSANRGGWFGQHQFSRCNAYLAENGMTPIVW